MSLSFFSTERHTSGISASGDPVDPSTGACTCDAGGDGVRVAEGVGEGGFTFDIGEKVAVGGTVVAHEGVHEVGADGVGAGIHRLLG